MKYEVWVRYADGVPAPSRTMNYRYFFKKSAFAERDGLNRFHRGICSIMGKEPNMEFYVINNQTGEEL